MTTLTKLSMNSGFPINVFVTIVSLWFFVKSLFSWTDNTVYWLVGSGLVLIFEFFVIKSFRKISFDEEFIYLRSYFSNKTEAISLENVMDIRLSSTRHGPNTFYTWLVYKDNQSKKEILFNLYLENYYLFTEILKRKGISLKIEIPKI